MWSAELALEAGQAPRAPWLSPPDSLPAAVVTPCYGLQPTITFAAGQRDEQGRLIGDLCGATWTIEGQ